MSGCLIRHGKSVIVESESEIRVERKEDGFARANRGRHRPNHFRNLPNYSESRRLPGTPCA